ncbi:glycosyltransferase family 4 protein [Legionella shakespearei]|uniref:Glycosyltransferase n=1 Tax=Legionella shakespearei DSM 23087 TaxID=1122169 RepID=A0A0W0Z520_9GAMM|nr:glycosyltransferase family 1 protein [Legionella shakespearei]KTD64193.1 glycosyltransferase [Legionella shakespearei DSM 23087]
MIKAKRIIPNYSWISGIVKVKNTCQMVSKVFLSRLQGKRHLLYDVSEIVRRDAKTGIQRVVREFYLFLINNCPPGYVVYPICAGSDKPYSYLKINCFNMRYPYTSHRVKIKPGDIYCAMDLCQHIITKHSEELNHWKEKGALLYFFIHDLLPYLHPQWFNEADADVFISWLKSVTQLADGFLCSSKVVQQDIIQYMKAYYEPQKNILPQIIPLGANFTQSIRSKGFPSNAKALFAQWKERITILMVGTIEPRKGHDDILSAIEMLWLQGTELNLIIVGKAGWKTDTLQERIRCHPEKDEKLFWLEHISDQMLEKVYQNTQGLIFASQAEGFGLPLIEALYYKKAVLARDIPIFRETGGESVSFFKGEDRNTLSEEIHSWLNTIQQGKTQSRGYGRTWDDAGRELLSCLPLKKSEPGN